MKIHNVDEKNILKYYKAMKPHIIMSQKELILHMLGLEMRV